MHIIRSLVVVYLLVITGVGFAADNSHSRTNQTPTEIVKKTNQPININTADAKKLTTLKGIGLKRAEAIVEYRKQHGDFKTVNDLTKVRGFSERIIKLNEGMIVLKDK